MMNTYTVTSFAQAQSLIRTLPRLAGGRWNYCAHPFTAGIVTVYWSAYAPAGF
jgi:hypothetical protein